MTENDPANQARSGRVHRLALIVPGDPDQATGGYRYDARVAAELRRLGMAVDVRRRRGAWLMRALVAAVHVGQRCWAGWWQIGG